MYVKSSWSEDLMLSLHLSSERSDDLHVLCSHWMCLQMQALLQRKAWLHDEFSFAFSSIDDASCCVSDDLILHRSCLRLFCSSSLTMREWIVFLSAYEIVFNSWIKILISLIFIISHHHCITLSLSYKYWLKQAVCDKIRW